MVGALSRKLGSARCDSEMLLSVLSGRPFTQDFIRELVVEVLASRTFGADLRTEGDIKSPIHALEISDNASPKGFLDNTLEDASGLRYRATALHTFNKYKRQLISNDWHN